MAQAANASVQAGRFQELANRGLVSRERRGRDLRQVQLYVSAKGSRLLAAAPRPLIGVLQQALSELPAARLRALHAALAHVIARMRGKQVAAARALPLSEM